VSDYTIERGLGVRERMDLLAAVNGPATLTLLEAVGVAVGWRCLELGCGGGHVSIELGRRVGPTGAVVGIDLDEELLGLARRDAAERGLGNITFRVADVETIAESGFDLAYARMVLMHLRDPGHTVDTMTAAMRTGGVVAVEDANFAGCFTFPPCSGYDKWVSWYQQTVRRRGGHPDLGPRLPSLLAAAGLADVQVRVAQPAYLAGPHKQLQAMSMAKQKQAVVATGVATADDYDAAHAELQAFIDDPTTLVAAPRVIQAWGRRR
jgi:SAM-dependent methyltransferase